MLFYTGLILLAMAVSLDGFGVGITYGLKQIRVPILAIGMIMVCSGLMVFISMMIGKWIGGHLSPDWARWMGGLILIVMGATSLYHALQSRNQTSPELERHPLPDQTKEKIWNLEIKKLGLVVTILKKPQQADLDRSGAITGRESVLLGTALSLDAFGAGLGAALLQFSPGLTSLLIALMSGLFVYVGIRSGWVLAQTAWAQKLTYIPPLLLISLGVLKIM